MSEVDRAAERAIVETLLDTYPDHAILAEEGTAQGKNAERRARVDHRSARRHDQLPARLSAVLRFDRAGAQGRDHAGRDLRPGAQRPVHRDARPRRVSQRSPHPRIAPAASARLPDRHRLSVPRRQLSRHLPRDDADDDHAHGGIAPPGRGGARPRLCRRGLLRRLLGSRASTRGTSRPAACWCSKRAA